MASLRSSRSPLSTVLKQARATVVRQHDQSDCGVAALLGIMRFYGRNAHLEYLRELSGTTQQGTTLLGLYQAAQELGFTASALQAASTEESVQYLREQFQEQHSFANGGNAINAINAFKAAPCILHIVKDGRLAHYVVCYAWDAVADAFIIGDPAFGVHTLKAQDLAALWQSKTLLNLTPPPNSTENNLDNEATSTKTAMPTKNQHLGLFWRHIHHHLSQRIHQPVRQYARQRWVWKPERWITDVLLQDVSVLVLASVLGVIIAALSLSTAIFSQKLVDTLLPSGDTVRLVVGLSLLVVLLVARSGLQFLRGHFIVLHSKAFNNRLISQFYATMLRLPQRFFDHRKTGDLIARMNDAQRLQQAVSYLAGEVMIDVILFCIAALVLALYAPPIAAFVVAASAVYAWWMARMHTPIVQAQKAVMSSYAVNESHYVDTIQGIATIKATGTEAVFSQLARTVYGNFQDQMVALGRIGVRFSVAVELTGVVVLAVVIAWASLLVLHGALLVGALIALVQMTSQITGVLARLAMTSIRLQEARVAVERMEAFTSIPAEYTEASEAQAHPINRFESLEIQHCRFRFAGRPALIHDISLRIRRGECVAITGESGTGKSTILQLIQRFYKPESGCLVVNGTTDLQTCSLQDWRHLVGAVPQQVHVFHGTVLENIALGYVPNASEPASAAEEAERIITFCRSLGFDHVFSRLPQGYMTVLGESGVKLSGGERQLLALLRALYRRPQLLLLDEASAAMDTATESVMMALLQRLQHDPSWHLAILMITHRSAPLAHADSVYAMKDGVLNVLATHDSRSLQHT